LVPGTTVISNSGRFDAGFYHLIAQPRYITSRPSE